MGVATTISKIAVAISIFAGIWALLPDAPPGDSSITIVDAIWNPLQAVLHFNKYLPIQEFLAIATFELGLRTALMFWGLTAWSKKQAVGDS